MEDVEQTGCGVQTQTWPSLEIVMDIFLNKYREEEGLKSGVYDDC